MRKSNIYTPGNRRKINPDWFTGITFMKDISGAIQSKEQDIYHVYFKGGSKTKLHSHNGNQVLIVIQGRGKLEFFKKSGNKKEDFKIKRTESTPLNPGDIAYIPKGILHTHGSSSKKLFSHIAINILPSKKTQFKTAWYESDFKTVATTLIH
ncbi:MAG: cupin domain-containing protein [Nitrososphaeria archaeon]|nr:cupin domain-containing protein [Nitrososphaeria archaeon]NDB63067.1 cupin domain-containing protein [Nitrosopumilaceae archaeon]NDB88269.1 cupin domain-containing protein [Nitrososphaerota archaeon]NDB47273.1 cupin domain-containing protein [Nitrososphaeria archaeon]NDB91502.1 cupin domain-containing protein [Nitrososphaeria archaeon]